MKKYNDYYSLIWKIVLLMSPPSAPPAFFNEKAVLFSQWNITNHSITYPHYSPLMNIYKCLAIPLC